MPPYRLKLAPGIWQDQYGISIVCRISRPKAYAEERFPLDTPLKTLREALEKLRVQLRGHRSTAAPPPKPKVTTALADDVPVYLEARAAMPTYKERKMHLEELWLRALGADGKPFSTRPRNSLLPHEIQAQRERWRLGGAAPGTVNKYLRSLSNLYTVLNGKTGHNPVREVAELDEPGAIPRDVPAPIVRAIFGAMGDTKTRARLEVIVSTGIEQAVFRKLLPEHLDLKAATVLLPRRGKGKKGAPARLLPLTTDGVRAFRSVIRTDAWGAYSTSSVYKSFRVACRHVERAHNLTAGKGDRLNLSALRPKDFRHTFGVAISLATGGNTSTIQKLLHHATPDMADRYRESAIPVHLREAVTQIRTRRLGVSVGRPKTSKKTRKTA